MLDALCHLELAEADALELRVGLAQVAHDIIRDIAPLHEGSRRVS